MNKQIEFLVKLRDSCQMLADAANEYIDSLASPEIKETNKTLAAVQEITFSTLKFETQQGAYLENTEYPTKQTI